jgi:hypothetical protein
VATRRVATQSRSTTWTTGSTHFSYGWSNRNYSTGGERKQYKHPEEEEYSEDPVDNLPPELYEIPFLALILRVFLPFLFALLVKV